MEPQISHADPVLAAAMELARAGTEKCCCGKVANKVHGSVTVSRPKRWMRSTVSCGASPCVAYITFGGPTADWSLAPKPPEFVREGRGKKAVAVLVKAPVSV